MTSSEEQQPPIVCPICNDGLERASTTVVFRLCVGCTEEGWVAFDHASDEEPKA